MYRNIYTVIKCSVSLYLLRSITHIISYSLFFFFNDTATTEIYTLSLHDALPICVRSQTVRLLCALLERGLIPVVPSQDRKSTRLNSSHPSISYAVFCLKKKNNTSDPRYVRILSMLFYLLVVSLPICVLGVYS